MRLYVFSFFLLTSHLAYAQIEFAPLGAIWHYHWSPFLGPTYYITTYPLEVTGLDTVQGIPCSRLVGTSGCASEMDFPYLLHQENEKVYRSINGSFHLLYDFSAQTGEEWLVPNLNSSGNGYDTLIVRVDSVSYWNINGYTRKVQHVSYPNYYSGISLDWGELMIESIGNNYFMYPQVTFCDPPTGPLRCYQDNQIEYILGYPCDTTIYFSDVNNPTTSTLGLIRPNPASDIVFLPEDLAVDQILLYDFSGRLWLQQPLENDQQIALDALPEGFFIARFFQKGKLVGMDKLLIMRH